ncbi:MAG TPA: Nif3-like dinuclear metal center hexameric protein [Chloroflexota bacterium]
MDRFEIAPLLESLAPLDLAESWDNVGWQIRLPGTLRGVHLALDVTPEVLDEATEVGANLVVSHHPPFFRPLRRIDRATPLGEVVARAFLQDIAVYAAHTNLDAVVGGVSWALGELLGLEALRTLHPVRPTDEGEPPGFGVVGVAPDRATLAAWERKVARLLGAPPFQRVGDGSRVIGRVAVVGGSGAPFIEDAVRARADLLVTADVKYHQAQEAAALGLAVLVVDHWASERPVLPRLAVRLSEHLDVPVTVSRIRTSPWSIAGLSEGEVS